MHIFITHKINLKVYAIYSVAVQKFRFVSKTPYKQSLEQKFEKWVNKNFSQNIFLCC